MHVITESSTTQHHLSLIYEITTYTDARMRELLAAVALLNFILGEFVFATVSVFEF